MKNRKEVQHAKRCECSVCLKLRMNEFEERIRLMKVPRLPESAEQCIPVRAHFRRSKNYLSATPKLRELVLERIKGIARKDNK